MLNFGKDKSNIHFGHSLELKVLRVDFLEENGHKGA